MSAAAPTGRACTRRVSSGEISREISGDLRVQAGPAHDGEGPLLVLEVKRHKDVVLGEEVDVPRGRGRGRGEVGVG